MSSIRYFNQSAPFWDFVARFEEEMFKEASKNDEDKEQNNDTNNDTTNEKDKDKDNDPAAETGGDDEKREHPHCGGARRDRGPCGGGGHWRRGGPCGVPHGHHGFGGGWGSGRGGCQRRAGWAGHGGWGGWNGARGPGGFDVNSFVQLLQSQLGLNNSNSESPAAGVGSGDGEGDRIEDFRPPVDVFTTPTAFHVHVSLPGAKKEDVGLNYDADKSELAIAGVVYRPGDEAFLRTLSSLRERAVGAFDRRVRLGNNRHPADVDVDGITARLEDGVLRIELPRLEKDDFVNVRKVDIE